MKLQLVSVIWRSRRYSAFVRFKFGERPRVTDQLFAALGISPGRGETLGLS